MDWISESTNRFSHRLFRTDGQFKPAATSFSILNIVFDIDWNGDSTREDGKQRCECSARSSHLLLWTNVIRDQSEIAIRWNEREDPFALEENHQEMIESEQNTYLPFLQSNTRMKTDIIQ